MTGQVWNKLGEFESRDLIERYIKVKHKRDASARQVLEISSNFIQGREYFLNSERAAISVKPLLQYYGVSAMTRGLILANSPHLSEAAMKPSHGLDAKNWKDTISSKKIENLTVGIQRGTFHELLTSTSNRTYFKHKSSGVNWKVDFRIPEVGTTVRFADLILSMPDFADAYQTWCEDKLAFLELETFQQSEELNECEYVVKKPRINNNEVVEIFPKDDFVKVLLRESEEYITITTLKDVYPQFSQRFFDPFKVGMGEVVLTKRINVDLHLSTLGQLYCLSFFLGMLSRYFPSFWISLGRTEKGDAIYPLFVKAIEFIEEHFPRTVAEFLEGPYDK